MTTDMSESKERLREVVVYLKERISTALHAEIRIDPKMGSWDDRYCPDILYGSPVYTPDDDKREQAKQEIKRKVKEEGSLALLALKEVYRNKDLEKDVRSYARRAFVKSWLLRKLGL
jgi:hypothetical protein